MVKITLITGDGIGPELSDAMRRCVDALKCGIEWDEQSAGMDVFEKEGTPLPERVIQSIKDNKIAIKAPLTTPIGKGFRSINVELRKKFDLYQNIRPAKIYPGVRTTFKNVDLVVFRENLEDLYAGIEFEKGSEECKELIEWIRKKGYEMREDSGVSIKSISVTNTTNIVRAAFEYARLHGRKKVTAVHKANIMKYSDGLFLSVAQDVAKEYSDIEFEDRIVDNMCMQLVQKPELYDVLVLPNLYGDVVSDLCSGLVGGLGVAPGANIGKEYAIFEAVHGSAPKYKGLNKVNPTAFILAAVMMLRHIGKNKEADLLENAVSSVIAEGKLVTYDLKQNRDDPSAVGTKEMADEIIEKINKIK